MLIATTNEKKKHIGGLSLSLGEGVRPVVRLNTSPRPSTYFCKSTNCLELKIHVTQDTEGDIFGAQMIKIPVNQLRILQNREGFDRRCNPDVNAALQCMC